MRADAPADGVPGALHTAFDLVLLDLDGVVYVGADAVPGAVGALARLRSAGVATGYATNNASRPPREVVEHLRRLGITVEVEDVTTSAQAGAGLVLDRVGEGARVLAIGGPGVAWALRDAGLVPIDGAAADEQPPAAVLQGFGSGLAWRDLADAAAAVRAGALWVATNTDLTLPTERGPAPGNGSLVGAVRNAVDVDPLVAGKPEPTLFTAAAQRAGARAVLAVGDRLDTDIAGAVRSGMASLLVLTGLTAPHQVLSAPPGQRPDHLGADLAALFAPPAVVAPEGTGLSRACGTARARVQDGLLLASQPTPGADGLLDLLRACAATSWAAADGGVTADPEPALLTALEALVGG